MAGADTTGSADPWSGVWTGLVHCGACNALHRDVKCSLCGDGPDHERYMMDFNGFKVLSFIRQGAIPYSVFVLLRLMRVEWERPAAPQRVHTEAAEKLVIVILFWTLFETLMEGFYEAAFADLPGELGEELLQRFPGVGGRLDRLYRRRWGTTFWDDLKDAGYPQASAHLKRVQTARNEFVHCDPAAIKDELVEQTVALLRDTQLGWIAVFNKRCTALNRKIQLWMKEAPSLAPKKT